MLEKEENVILQGNLSVAHTKQDFWCPEAFDEKTEPGRSDEEKSCFQKLLDCGFEDGCRYFNRGVSSSEHTVTCLSNNNQGTREY